jgi:hypothetical protein
MAPQDSIPECMEMRDTPTNYGLERETNALKKGYSRPYKKELK